MSTIIDILGEVLYNEGKQNPMGRSWIWIMRQWAEG